MKRKTALYNIKQAYKTWNPAENYTEFFQSVNEILKKFEEDIRSENIGICKTCGADMTIKSTTLYCKNPYCDNYLKTIKYGSEK